MLKCIGVFSQPEESVGHLQVVTWDPCLETTPSGSPRSMTSLLEKGSETSGWRSSSPPESHWCRSTPRCWQGSSLKEYTLYPPPRRGPVHTPRIISRKPDPQHFGWDTIQSGNICTHLSGSQSALSRWIGLCSSLCAPWCCLFRVDQPCDTRGSSAATNNKRCPWLGQVSES